jgi:hypothetical protein
MPVPTRLRRVVFVSLAGFVACLSGCDDRDGVRVYVAPKDPPPMAAPVGQKPVEWKLPEGWTELPDVDPGQFGRFATIEVSKDDPSLQLAVNMLEGAGSGDLLPNLNRWEGQLGLAPTPAAEAPAKAKMLEVDGHAGHRVDLTGSVEVTAADGNTKTPTPMRLLAFILPHGEQAWSFKLQGPPDKIAAQEAAFDAFVASVRFTSHDHGDEGAAAAAGPSAPRDDKTYALKKFATPPGWERDPAERPMRVMTFNVAGAGGAADNERAELLVTKFARDRFGSILENVNRWRREVGLPPSQDETKENLREVTTAAGARAVVFDFAPPGDPAAAGARRSFVAMLPQGGEMWFVKLIGPPRTVADQRANYDAFLQSLEFGDAGE